MTHLYLTTKLASLHIRGSFGPVVSIKMSSSQQPFTLLSGEDDSMSDECDCDCWDDEKDKALKAFFQKQAFRPDWCKGCAFSFYKGMYDFVYGSRVLMNEQMFAEIIGAYSVILAAYYSMNPQEVYFSKEFYDFVYREVTRIVMARKGKLMGDFHEAFCRNFGKLMENLKFCGGYNPPRILGHQNFDKSK